MHTRKNFDEHGVFRLGDIVGSDSPQIFEQLESKGYKIGAISAMNAENRLKKPAFFIPDPWTNTPTDGSWWSKTVKDFISQTVNDNAQGKVTIKSAVQLIFSMIRFARPKHYRKYLGLILKSKAKPWSKALMLDLLLHDIHWRMFHNKAPDFSTLFLNAGAHIQHHYLFNSKPLREDMATKNPTWYIKPEDDPIADMLTLYDAVVGEYVAQADFEVILATGLAQKPYDRVKFYYRLNSHSSFLQSLGIDFTNVYPRMTRDFLIEFDTEEKALSAQDILDKIRIASDNLPLFGEIDNRGKSLFVTLTYPNEITASTQYTFNNVISYLKPLVSFVAIKNGMHQTEGFAFFSPGVRTYAPKNFDHVSKIGNTIMQYFGASI